MKVVVGLGNPGSQYSGTRHNVGFDVLDRLARLGLAALPKAKFEALAVDVPWQSDRLLLVWPQTYMNLSGRSVQQVLKFYQAPLDQLLVICDDMNLPLGGIRLRANGSAGGQKGLQNIIQATGSDQFARLRIGVGRPPGKMDAADYVLAKFRSHEQDELLGSLDRAVDAVYCWAERGIDEAMNRFNASGGGSERDSKSDRSGK